MKTDVLKLLVEDAKKFALIYDSQPEDDADAQRGEFLKRFPLESLPSLKLNDYVIGNKATDTFCYWAEPGTDMWARIMGASATKFGIYFGKTNKDRTNRYRYTKKFAGDLPLEGEQVKVYKNVHAELLKLLEHGHALDFLSVDKNLLSPMFKAKILSLYFKDLYLPICSEDILRDVAQDIELDSISPSEIQHQALQIRKRSKFFRDWHNLKLSKFLRMRATGALEGMTAPKPKRPQMWTKVQNLDYEPDFEDLAKKAREKGEKSERFALEWEKSRLVSRGLGALANKILDRTKKPRYGFDFESFTTIKVKRYIEVKTFSSSKFFLSANELRLAQDDEIGPNYYFYLITYGNKGEPESCHSFRAADVLEWCQLKPQNFMVIAPKGFEKHDGREAATVKSRKIRR
ncbi:DUF3883 domain-containing protein [Alcaligenes faecalis]|uniref:DUF3883 domain-containing protein n=1 Tax=Alcaligenes faecalis TaxID=511 RepID=UPI00203EFE89|nr:DUF3883 domain-containing protein [Alcaligenes faecalis]MCM2621505.1 DUF3883 domain-containing protein [Alcaligenes faecalis]